MPIPTSPEDPTARDRIFHQMSDLRGFRDCCEIKVIGVRPQSAAFCLFASPFLCMLFVSENHSAMLIIDKTSDNLNCYSFASIIDILVALGFDVILPIYLPIEGDPDDETPNEWGWHAYNPSSVCSIRPAWFEIDQIKQLNLNLSQSTQDQINEIQKFSEEYIRSLIKDSKEFGEETGSPLEF